MTLRATRPHAAWLLPAVATALIVSWGAGRPVPWRDEFASWSAASRTVGEIVDLGRTIDGVLVPYYLLLHAWIGWSGDSVTAMRIPSIVAMTATSAAVALLARRLWGDGTGLLGGLLFAVLPVVSRYGQEIRGYAFACLFVTLSTLMLVAALDRPRWWRWIGYSACVALMGLAHLVSLLVLTGHLVAVLVVVRHTGRRRALWWSLAVATGCTAVLPLTISGLGQRDAQLNWLDTATPSDLAGIAGTIFETPLSGGAVAALGVAALTAGRARPAAVLWSAVLLPIAVLYTYDQLVTPIFVGRYLLFAVPLLCALAGGGLAALRLPVALAVVVALGATGLPRQAEIRQEHSSIDYRAAAAVLAANARPGDGAVYAPRDGWQLIDVGVGYYLRDRAPDDLLLATGAVAAGSLWPVECADVPPCLRRADRVWVVAADNLNPAYRATATNQLDYARRAALTGYVQLVVWRVDGVTIALFVRPPAV